MGSASLLRDERSPCWRPVPPRRRPQRRSCTHSSRPTHNEPLPRGSPKPLLRMPSTAARDRLIRPVLVFRTQSLISFNSFISFVLCKKLLAACCIPHYGIAHFMAGSARSSAKLPVINALRPPRTTNFTFFSDSLPLFSSYLHPHRKPPTHPLSPTPLNVVREQTVLTEQL